MNFLLRQFPALQFMGTLGFLEKNLKSIIFRDAEKQWFAHLEKWTEVTFGRVSVMSISLSHRDVSSECSVLVLKARTCEMKHLKYLKSINRKTVTLHQLATCSALKSFICSRRQAMNIMKNAMRSHEYEIFKSKIQFKPIQQFRILLDVNELYISSFISSNCSGGFVEITDMKEKYCGQQPAISVFSHTRKVHVSIQFHIVVYFRFVLHYSVIDSLVAKTIFSNNTFANNCQNNFAQIYPEMWFHIRVGEMDRIEIQVANQIKGSVYIYDGPQSQSKLLNFTPRTLSFSRAMTSTFQAFCVSLSNTGNIIFTAIRQLVSVNISVNELTHLSHNNLRLLSQNSLILGEVKGESFINVTLTSMHISGKLSSICSFSGISFFDSGSNTRKIRTTCLPSHCEHRHRSVFSKSTTLYLVVFSYKEYAEIFFNMELALTNCTTFALNLATINDRCVVLPLSQDSPTCHSCTRDVQEGTLLEKAVFFSRKLNGCSIVQVHYMAPAGSSAKLASFTLSSSVQNDYQYQTSVTGFIKNDFGEMHFAQSGSKCFAASIEQRCEIKVVAFCYEQTNSFPDFWKRMFFVFGYSISHWLHTSFTAKQFERFRKDLFWKVTAGELDWSLPAPIDVSFALHTVSPTESSQVSPKHKVTEASC